MPFPARPPLPPDVDPELWFDTEHCGRHYLLDGNPHTFPGRMYAYCAERGIRTRVSKGEISDCSTQARYFVRGYLSGSEPAPPESDRPTESAALAWSDAVARFRDTGCWVGVDESADAAADVDTDRSEETGADPDGGTDAEAGEIPQWLQSWLREQATARVALVVDVPNSNADHAIEVATTLANRVGRQTCDRSGPVEVSRPVSFTRVYALVGVTGHRPWVAVHTAMTALGRSGWAPATAVEGEQYVTAEFRAERELNQGLDALGVSAVEIHAAYGLGHDPSRTPGSWWQGD
ncbi:hypothetical protein [Salinispora cortesiana]|uniref:hypothetical protein n=1 Tax=Salinispora cortesiana TaxID=1305843 RepID=UPI00046EE2E4|nr:hypothetical protein [Salinispora cortesiana]